MKVKSKEKRWIAMAVMVLIWLLAFPLIASAANTSGYWEYTVSDQRATITAYNGKNAEVIIPEFIDGYRVVAIGKEAFENNLDMVSVWIPSTIESIASRAFGGCGYLEKIYFNAETCNDASSTGNIFADVGKYGDGISVVIGNGVTKIPAYLFYSHSGAYPKITNLVVSESVVSIGENAFRGCEELVLVSLNEGIRVIGRQAFQDCVALESITIPKTVETIRGRAFAGCKYLKEINFNATNCDDMASSSYPFDEAGKYNDSIKVTFGNDVERIPGDIFRVAYQKTLKIVDITIPESVESIGEDAFNGCEYLESITVLNDNVAIYSNAFQNIFADAIFTCYYGSTTDAFALSNNYGVKYLPPYTPENLLATGDSASITLSWDTARGAQGYQLYRKTDSTEWEKVYSGIGTIYEDTDILRGQTYYYTVAAYAPDVVGERSDSISITYNGNSSTGGSTGSGGSTGGGSTGSGSTGGGSSTGGSSTGGGSSGGSGGGGGCYVATAVYGSYDCPEVWTLRRYRDYELSQTASGRAFIKTYYAVSPTIVKYFGEEEWFQDMWRGPLNKMVSDLQEKGYEATPYEDIEW